MAGASTIGGAEENPVAINVTPMVDVIFCLCLFFMCSFHFRQREASLPSWQPRTHGVFTGPVSLDPAAAIVDMAWRAGRLEVGVRGLAAHNDHESVVADLRGLRADIDRASKSGFRVVVLAAEDVSWESVVHLLDLCRGAGFHRVELGAPERPL